MAILPSGVRMWDSAATALLFCGNTLLSPLMQSGTVVGSAQKLNPGAEHMSGGLKALLLLYQKGLHESKCCD